MWLCTEEPLIALAENTGSIPSACMVVHNLQMLSSRPVSSSDLRWTSHSNGAQTPLQAKHLYT